MSRFVARLFVVVSQHSAARSVVLPRRSPVFIRPVSTSQGTWGEGDVWFLYFSGYTVSHVVPQAVNSCRCTVLQISHGCWILRHFKRGLLIQLGLVDKIQLLYELGLSQMNCLVQKCYPLLWYLPALSSTVNCVLRHFITVFLIWLQSLKGLWSKVGFILKS